MNILVLPSWYPSQNKPLNGIFFKEQVEALKRNLSELDKIFVLAYEEYSLLNLFPFLRATKSEFIEENNVCTYRYSYLKLIPKFHYLFFRFASFLLKNKINKINKTTKIDIIHIHSALNAGIYYYLSGLDIPYIITEHHSAFSRKKISKIQEKYLANTFNNAYRVIAVSNGLRKDIRKYTNNDISVVYNLVNINFQTNLKQKEISKNTQKMYFSFFSLGLDSYKKGLDILIKAFLLIKNDNVSLTIAGLSDKEKNELSILFKSTKITLLGRLTREEVFEYMDNCNCFILPSRYETFGIVFAEAMFLGKPVICSKTGGPDSFVTKEVGLCVPIEDINATYIAMEEMIKNYDKYDKQKIISYALSNFGEKSICKKIIALYKETTK